MKLADYAISTIPWGNFYDGEHAKAGLHRLLEAADASAAVEASEVIQRYAVSQETVYQVAEPVVSVMVAIFADEWPKRVQLSALECLLMILSGEPGDGESPDLIDRCFRRAMEGYWLLVRESLHGERRWSGELVQLLNERR